jgi:hypothetical protein
MSLTPEQIDALKKLANTPDDVLLEQARRKGVDVEELAEKQRKRIYEKMGEIAERQGTPPLEPFGSERIAAAKPNRS